MRKIIDGLLYDTELSTEICSTEGITPNYGVRYEASYIYVTRKGRFFISGRDETAFPCDKRHAGRWKRSSEDIFAVSESEAKALVERFGSVSDYISHFGEPEEA